MCSSCGVLVCWECKPSLVMKKNAPCPRCSKAFHVSNDKQVKRPCPQGEGSLGINDQHGDAQKYQIAWE